METRTAEYAFQVDSLAPNIVEGIEKTGLEFGFLADLTLKTVYADADCSTLGTGYICINDCFQGSCLKGSH